MGNSTCYFDFELISEYWSTGPFGRYRHFRACGAAQRQPWSRSACPQYAI